MVSDISLTGLSANDPVPGEYIEVNFAQGDASLGTGVYNAIVMGGMTPSGAADFSVVYGPSTPFQLTSESDAITLFGEGSELHRMIRRFLKVNKTTPLYAIAVDDGYGTGALRAEGEITLTGSATSGGVLRVFVDDEFVDVGFVSGDSLTDIAIDAVVNVNSKSHWPCFAQSSLGVITLFTKQAGDRSNQHRFFAQVRPITGSGLSVTPVVSTLFTGGTVQDDNTDALAAILPDRFYYIVSAANDTTQVGDLLDQVDSQSLPITGIRQRVFCGKTAALSNAIALTTSLNGARAEVQWLKESDMCGAELAANNAAVYALYEAPSVPKLNFDSFGDDASTSISWFVKAPLSGAKPSRAEIFAALNAGVTPIGVRTTGSTYLVKRITSRYLNGAVVDYRIRDAHKVTVCDRYADDLIAKAAATLRGKQAGDDPVKNSPVPPDQVVTPRIIKASIDRLTDDYAEDALVQNADAIKAGTIVLRGPATRMSARIPLQPVDILDQVAFKVDQVG